MSARTFLKSHRSWLLIAAGCVVLAAFSSFAVYLNSRLAGRTNWSDVIFTASLWLVFAVLTRIPYVLAHRFPLKREQVALAIVAHFFGSLGMSRGRPLVVFLLA